MAPRDSLKEEPMKALANLAYGPHERQVLDLYLPEAASGRLPLVVCIHGGGWMSGNKEDCLRWVRRIVAAGLAAASINHRYCTESPWPAPLDDAQRAVRWLRHEAARYGLDAARFGATGSSSGGHLAVFLALAETRLPCADELSPYSSRVGCVVDCYGPVDMLWVMRSASAPIVERLIGRDLSAESVADYLAASPLAMVRPPVPPMLIQHGELDVGETRGQVPIGISRRLAELLRAAGGEAEFMMIPGQGHGWDPEAGEGLTATDAMVKFFLKHLAGR
jgi:acetyl esterase/lipase